MNVINIPSFSFYIKIKDLFADKTIRFSLLTTFCLLVIMLIIIGIFYRSLPPFIPLYNQMPWGEERLAPVIYIFLPFIITLFVFCTNIITASYLYKKIPLLSRLFSLTSLLLASLAFLFLIRTIQLIA